MQTIQFNIFYHLSYSYLSINIATLLRIQMLTGSCLVISHSKTNINTTTIQIYQPSNLLFSKFKNVKLVIIPIELGIDPILTSTYDSTILTFLNNYSIITLKLICTHIHMRNSCQTTNSRWKCT